jgi:hypothetical protein
MGFQIFAHVDGNDELASDRVFVSASEAVDEAKRLAACDDGVSYRVVSEDDNRVRFEVTDNAWRWIEEPS